VSLTEEEMKKILLGAAAICSTMLAPSLAIAQTEIQFWHAFTGRLGDLVAEQISTFNASQSDYKVVGSHKGNYSETLNAGIAAFRAKEQPNILMVFEVGTATMMGAKGAIKPVYEVMSDAGATFDQDAFIGSVKGYYTSTDGQMLSLPFNSSTPVLWVNKDALKAAGIDPEIDLSTWNKVGDVLDKLKASGNDCPLTTAWQSWIHLENLSAYHNTPFATRDNGFAGLDTTLAFNSPLQVTHIRQWVIGPKKASSSMQVAAMKAVLTSALVSVHSSPRAQLVMLASRKKLSLSLLFARSLIGKA
jgi:sn-glycerol 3-phosphate transport system substrate-binding protein